MHYSTGDIEGFFFFFSCVENYSTLEGAWIAGEEFLMCIEFFAACISQVTMLQSRGVGIVVTNSYAPKHGWRVSWEGYRNCIRLVKVKELIMSFLYIPEILPR